MNIEDVDIPTLERADIVIIGCPVYYGKLDPEIVSFILEHQQLLIERKYCLYITGILQTEFMTYVTQSFDYDIFEEYKSDCWIGGALYYPELSISEKMVLQVMNKRSPIIKSKQKKCLRILIMRKLKFCEKIQRLS